MAVPDESRMTPGQRRVWNAINILVRDELVVDEQAVARGAGVTERQVSRDTAPDGFKEWVAAARWRRARHPQSCIFPPRGCPQGNLAPPGERLCPSCAEGVASIREAAAKPGPQQAKWQEVLAWLERYGL